LPPARLLRRPAWLPPFRMVRWTGVVVGSLHVAVGFAQGVQTGVQIPGSTG